MTQAPPPTDPTLPPPSAPRAFRPKRVLKGRYELEARLASGSMGAVWRARDLEVDRLVAIKIAGPECLRDRTFRERFRREVRHLISFEHPHIVRLYDLGEEDQVPYAVLAYLEGGNLGDRARRLGTGDRARLPTSDVARWLPPLAEALDFIHARGVVHRDVKPENILFDAADHVYLADFGISKAVGRELSLTPQHLLVGTIRYLAPEAIAETAIAGAFDQYSLASVVFEVLSGVSAFGGGMGTILRRKMLEDAPHLAALTPGAALARPIDAALTRALSREPSARFPTCRAFVAALLGT